MANNVGFEQLDPFADPLADDPLSSGDPLSSPEPERLTQTEVDALADAFEASLALQSAATAVEVVPVGDPLAASDAPASIDAVAPTVEELSPAARAVVAAIAEAQQAQVDDVKSIEVSIAALPSTIERYAYSPDELRDLVDGGSLAVVDADSSAKGWAILRRLKTAAKRVATHYDDATSGRLRVWSAIVDRVRALRNNDARPFVDTVDALERKLDAWDRAEAELERLAREAEKVRVAAEQAKLREAADLARKATVATPVEAAQLNAKASAVAGSADLAPRTVSTRRPTAKSVGGHFVERWTGAPEGATPAELLASRIKFLEAVKAGQIPIPVAAAALDFDRAWLNAQAADLHERMGSVYPGLTATSNRSTSTRR